MSDWNRVQLGDLCDAERGITYGIVKVGDYVPGGVPVIRGGDIRDNRIAFDDEKRVSLEVSNQFKRTILQGGEIVLNLIAEPGHSAVVPSMMAGYNVSRDVAVISLSSRSNHLFVNYFLKSPEAVSWLEARLNGSVTQKINLGVLREIPIPLPSRSCQDGIAGILGALDAKIAVNNRIAVMTRTLASAHFRAVWETVDSEDVELASVAKSLNRGVAPRYTDDLSQLYVLNQKCIRDGRVSLAPSRRTLFDKVPGDKMLRMYDVLVNSTGVGTLGRVARWTRNERCTVDSHVTIVRFDPAKIDPVCAGFAMLEAEAEIESLGQGSTGQTELGRAQLSGLRITVPSKERAAKLRPTLDALENRGDSALEESLSLAQLRDTLLPKLMSGEIRVRDAEKVVEDVT